MRLQTKHQPTVLHKTGYAVSAADVLVYESGITISLNQMTQEYKAYYERISIGT